MKSPFKIIDGSVTAPAGFLASAVFCDIKRIDTGKGSRKGPKPDLAIIASAAPCTAAGLFTTNQVCAAPVKVCREYLERPRAKARAIVANSGNANACTGPAGLRDARRMTALTAGALSTSPEEVLVCSTGRIGIPLPMTQVRDGILNAVQQLGPGRDHAHAAARAIMTSDSRPKEIAVEVKVDTKPVRIGGLAKGAGMIQPGMSPNGQRPPSQLPHATMLSFITTDAAVATPLLKRCLREAMAGSFNRITVDGDMSTNDTVLMLANGLAGNRPLAGPNLARFQAALNHVALELAKMIVRDGEGVSRFVTLRVSGARTSSEADAAARAVANSALVKTSWCGGDPNWGRILDALGYSPAQVREESVDVAYSLPGARKRLYSVKSGRPTRTTLEALSAITDQPEFDLHIHLNLGKGSALLYAADLTEEYVDFNKGE